MDFATVQKICGAPSEQEARRYSPGKCIGCDMKQYHRLFRRLGGGWRSRAT